MLSWFVRKPAPAPEPAPEPANPGRELANIGHRQRRAAARTKIRAVADQMRIDAGMPPVEWPAL